MRSHYWETRQSMTPEKSLLYLQEGNDRFLKNIRVNRNLIELVGETSKEQFPFATILSCSDSRVSPTLVFDQGLGDIFSIRLAGNIASTNAIGSMEYACAVLGSKLVVVLGHTNCGAIKGACDNITLGNLTELIEHIRFSLHRETVTPTDRRNSKNTAFVNHVSELNVLHNIEIILEKSSIIRELIQKNEINIVGAMYCIETGKVNFFEVDAHQIIDQMFTNSVHTALYQHEFTTD